MPTSRAVAKLAGVSQATVSNVITGKVATSPEIRERVNQAIATLGYRPNQAARTMRTKRSGRLAVVLGQFFYNPGPVLAGTGQTADQAGYVMEVHVAEGDAEAYSRRVIELAESEQYEGILTFQPIVETLKPKVPKDIPIVLPAIYDAAAYNIGELADPQPVVEFIERLVALGHRRFLHVSGPEQYASAVARRTAYLTTVARLGLESLGVVGHAWTAEAGYNAIRDLPDDAPPLAVIAANDLAAVGVMRAATQRGWRVPGDISVTGWDNFDMSPYLTPSLTTVDVNRAEFGQR